MKDKPVYPTKRWCETNGKFMPDEDSGMTLREYYAGLAMQGLMTMEKIDATSEWNGLRDKKLARFAVKYADALIAELQKEQK